MAFQDWTEHRLTLDEIRSILRGRRESFGIERIRNARIEKDLAALAILRDADAAYTGGELRQELAEIAEEGILPQALLDLETEGLGFAVSLSWAACRPDGSYDACFAPIASGQGVTLQAIRWPEPDASSYVYLTNAPGQGALRKELIDRLFGQCRRILPEETVLRGITLVDTLVRTPDGDVDFRALQAAASSSYLS